MLSEVFPTVMSVCKMGVKNKLPAEIHYSKEIADMALNENCHCKMVEKSQLSWRSTQQSKLLNFLLIFFTKFKIKPLSF